MAYLNAAKNANHKQSMENVNKIVPAPATLHRMHEDGSTLFLEHGSKGTTLRAPTLDNV